MTRGMTAKKLIRTVAIVLLFVVILGYALWRSQDLLFGIRLKVEGLSPDTTFTESVIELKGRAKRATEIRVNDRIVPVDQEGIWVDTLALLPGYNVLTVSAKDKFGRSVSRIYRLYYRAPEPVVEDKENINEEILDENEDEDTMEEDLEEITT